MMNKVTRRLSKIPEEVRAEISSYFVDSAPVVPEDNRKLTKLDESANFIRTGLSVCKLHVIIDLFSKISQMFSNHIMCLYFQPRWNDLDVNQHVNNVKYVGWILEVVFCSCIIIILSLISFLLLVDILVRLV